jgi:hypothetical protein
MKPRITTLAAVRIAIIIILAFFYHISNSKPFLTPIVLLVLAIKGIGIGNALELRNHLLKIVNGYLGTSQFF